MMDCLSRCLSPVACGGFGYCREKNLPHQTDGTSWLRYARHDDVPAITEAGWTICADIGPTHGFYAVLMRWCGEGDPS